MNTLLILVIINILMFSSLSAVYLYLYRQYQEKYMGIWGLGWLCAGLRIGLDLLRFMGYESTLLLVLNHFFTLSAVMLLIWGMYRFMGQRLPSIWLVLGFGVTLFADIALLSGFSFNLAGIPTVIYLLVGHFWLGVKFLRYWQYPGIGKYITGYANIFLGFLIFSYPFMVVENSLYSVLVFFSIGIILSLMILIGILLIYFEKVRYDLTASEQRFRLIAENAKDVVYRFQFSSGGRFDYLSPSVYRLTGYKPEELYRSPELLDEIIGRDYEEFLKEVQSGYEEQLKVFKICTKEGNVVWVEQTFVPIRDGQGQVIALEGIVRDITERRKLEKEMARLDNLRLTGETAAGIAHEVRNPLTTVRGFLQIMEQKTLFKDYKDILQLMISELDRANHIITNFLAFSREQDHHPQYQNLTKLISDMVPIAESNALFSGKQIKTSLGETPNFSFDENEIKQMVLNLVQNGLEAMEAGGTLEIHTYHGEGKINLVVKDQGRGIGQDILDKLGTPFFTTKAKGTGLGLAVCYGIAAKHHATISVETGANGTSFTVSFRN